MWYFAWVLGIGFAVLLAIIVWPPLTTWLPSLMR